MPIENVSLAECRRAIFDQFIELKKGNISINEAIASSKMMHQIISSYEVEVKATETSIQLMTHDLGLIDGTSIKSLPNISNV